MAMQGSGTISIGNIRTEHGNTSGADGLSEYRRKGRNQKPVPDNDKNDAVPTSGTIRLSNFYSSVGTYASHHTFTMGAFGGKITGSASGAFSPTTIWTGAGGLAIGIIGASGANGQGLVLSMSGSRAKAYISKIHFQNSTYYTSASTHSAASTTTWTWTANGVVAGASDAWFYQ
jgi:hypothetical protein